MPRHLLMAWLALSLLAACGGETVTPVEPDGDEPIVDVTADVDGATSGDVQGDDTGPEDVGQEVVSGPVASCEGQGDGTVCVADSLCSETGVCAAGVCEPDTPCVCKTDGDCPQPESLCEGAVVCDTSGEVPACVVDPATVVVCEPSSSPCLDNLCQPESGACAEVPVADGVACDDGDACTDGDGCVAGSCAGATPVTCDDGLYCNGVESCDALIGCVAGEAPAVDDGVACTVDTCDEDTDSAVHIPEDQACQNGFFCDGFEVCDATEGCQQGEAPVVDDGIGCTDDACDEAQDMVVNVANDSLCDDGLYCTGVETCDAELDCQVGEPPALDDGVDCTVDTCDEALGAVVHTPEPSLCDDDNPCTAELCDPEEGCGHEADDSGLCSDEDPCTGGDQCVDSVCVGTPILSEGPVCNNVDDDCDGATDEDCTYRLNGHVLGDGFGTGGDDTGATLHGTLGAPKVTGTSSNGSWTVTSGLPSAKEN